jgi:hypothetical protein
MTYLRGYTLSCGKKGLKAIKIKPRDVSPRDPREGNKKPLSKKQEGPEEK